MTGIIRFPHLGIELTHIARSFRIGPLTIAFYGLIIGIAMLTGLMLTEKAASATGQDPDQYVDLGLLAIVMAVIGARIYYVAFSWDYYRSHLSEIPNLREGGLAIYGGILGGILAVLLFARWKKKSALVLLDTACLGLLWGQILGRWGNFFNREAFGEYTDSLFAMQLPLQDVNTADVTQKMMDHLVTVDKIQYIQVHPTFLYESLWNLGVLAVLLALTFLMDPGPGASAEGKRRRPAGLVFWSYLLLYGIGRFFIEGLRTDQLILWGTSLPVSQLLSGILVLFSLAAVGWVLGRSSRR